MRTLTLQEVAAAMGGRIHGQITLPTVTGVSTDSREPVEGSLFFAIIGEQFDGHAYVNDILERGAVAAVVSDLAKINARYHDGGRLIQVADSVEALGKLAQWYRKQFAASVIGVVGSNGKTTTKDMIAAVLGSKKRGRAAPASFNNAIGVPLTLLSVEPPDEFVVVEIGTNHHGEILALGRIAQPDMAVVTSIGEEHLESFGNVRSVALEEFSLIATMRGRAFIAMHEETERFVPNAVIRECATLTYGLEDGAELRATDLVADHDGQRFKVNGRFAYRIGLLGAHNVMNALAAVAIGTRFRLSHDEIAAALLDVQSPPMRMERSHLGNITLVNDAYNANPSSMRVAFDVMDHLPPTAGKATAGRKVFILGDMWELGDAAERCHQEVGREAGRSTAHVIIAVGTHARAVADGATATAGTNKRIYSFPHIEALTEKIGGLIKPGDAVLLKASRAVRLEQLVDRLRRKA